MKIVYGVATLFVIALLAGAATIPTGPILTENHARVAESELAAPQPRHTMSTYLTLEKGMSYDDAARALGVPGREVPADNSSPFKGAQVYVWRNPDGSQILLAFRNDRLLRWTQEGLQ